MSMSLCHPSLPLTRRVQINLLMLAIFFSPILLRRGNWQLNCLDAWVGCALGLRLSLSNDVPGMFLNCKFIYQKQCARNMTPDKVCGFMAKCQVPGAVATEVITLSLSLSATANLLPDKLGPRSHRREPGMFFSYFPKSRISLHSKAGSFPRRLVVAPWILQLRLAVAPVQELTHLRGS